MTRPAPEEIERIRLSWRKQYGKELNYRDVDRLLALIDWQAARIRELEKTEAELNAEAQMYARKLSGHGM